MSDHCSTDKLHSLVASDYQIDRDNLCLWDQSLWQQIVELGWPAVCVPEANGGIGMPLVAAVALAEEIGKAGFPSPLLGIFNSTFVLRACDSAAAHQALASIAGGKTMTLAITNAAGSWHSDHTDVEVNKDGSLTGNAYFVQDARKCEQFLVSARGDKGVGLYLVDASASGLTLIPDSIVDLTRDQAHLSFSDVAAVEMASPGKGSDAIANAIPAILCIVSADMVGAGEWLLQTTVEYAKTRIQFDHPLGFFQAVKHPIVDMMIQTDETRSLVYNAACAFDYDKEDALRCAHLAKSNASDTASLSSQRSTQLHGGIGFTWEADIQIYHKRQIHSQFLFGDGTWQRKKLAELI